MANVLTVTRNCMKYRQKDDIPVLKTQRLKNYLASLGQFFKLGINLVFRFPFNILVWSLKELFCKTSQCCENGNEIELLSSYTVLSYLQRRFYYKAGANVQGHQTNGKNT